MFEVVCGNCQGRLLVQKTGVVVACPHCQTHLTIGGPAPAPLPVPAQPQAFAPQPQVPAWTPPPSIPQQVAPPPPQLQPQFAPAPVPAPVQFTPPAVEMPDPQIAAPPPVFAPAPEVSVPAAFAPPPAFEPAPQATADVAPNWFAPQPESPPAAPEQAPMGFAAETPALMAPTPQAFEALPAFAAAPVPSVAPVLAAPAPTYQPAPVAEAPVVAPQVVPAAFAPQYAPAPQPAPVQAPPQMYAPQPVAPQPAWGQQPGMLPIQPQVAVAPIPPQTPAAQFAPAQPNWQGSMPPAAPDLTPHPYGQSYVDTPGVDTYQLVPGTSDPGTWGAPTGVASPQPAASKAPTPPAGVPRSTFMLLANYASIVTIVALYLAYRVFGGVLAGDESERLPDVEPRMKGNQVSFKVAPPDHRLPAKQNFEIGQTTQLGFLKITPVKVTQGEVEYAPLSGPRGLLPQNHRSLKLWLRIENVSKDQDIAPLRSLGFKHDAAKKEGNNFVCAVSQKTAKGHKVWPVKLDKQPYKLKAHNIDMTLKPGESYETYIPTAVEGLDKMLDAGGPLVWRVWLRKGYSPKNYGVTTLIDVQFDDSDIKSDA